MENRKVQEEQIALLLRQLAEELNFFPKETAQIMYAKQLTDKDVSLELPESMQEDKKNEDRGQRLKKMMEEARLKWDYAGDAQKKNVAAMEAMIQEYNDKIKQLFT